MGKFLLLVLKNLGRNKVRTLLTALAITVLVTICAVVTTVTSTVEKQVNNSASKTKLMVSERWVAPSEVPMRYVPQVANLPGVEDWTVWNFYAGYFGETLQSDKLGFGIATRVDNLAAMHSGLEDMDPALVEALRREKSGALMGATLMEAMNWKVGQQFTFTSTSHRGKNLRFKIVGVMPRGAWALNFFFRQDYFEEATENKSSVNMILLRARDAEVGRQIAASIQDKFNRRQPEVKVETESAGVARFAARGQAILGIIKMVVLILMIDMIIILSNSISISTRERRVEMAVLKVLGFKPSHIMAMVIGEATFIGALSGLLGATLAWGSSALASAGWLPASGFTAYLTIFPMHVDTLTWGLLLGASVGFIGSAIPAWNSRKVKVSDVFARIA